MQTTHVQLPPLVSILDKLARTILFLRLLYYIHYTFIFSMQTYAPAYFSP